MLKRLVAAVVVPLCVVWLATAIPWQGRPGEADVARSSPDTVTRGIAPAPNQTTALVERARAQKEVHGPEAVGADVSGPARVIDGDTIEVGGARIRLHGIDSPEGRQTCLAPVGRWPCGQRATRALARLIGARPVACDARDRDRYGRIVAVCRQDGQDINAWLVAEGWALAYRRYSLAYVDEESAARAARHGVWRGDFVAPWDWRRGERLLGAGRGVPQPRANADAPSADNIRGADCNIKGNVSYKGDRLIYHVAEDRDYAGTRIDPSRGERWFCSEAQARAAGWRRAGQ